ncbi:hypothetical protein [Gimesia aquarii]|uniref:Uncharacterized protein n=1 Tax=Gimesia aquarii TaxID=2527964 RepID=A0A517WXG3_9PLAN|nr:hypothetical protein [Gimesia aquarii]QDU09938.1 hypothetical protein V202x_33350 [Gimesia aquarii]
MLVWFVLIDCLMSFFSTTSHFGELHEAVKRSLCALMSRLWYLRVRAGHGFGKERTIWDQNGSEHRELNLRRSLQNFECLAGFMVKVFAAAKVITIRKNVASRARRRNGVSREARLCQGVVCLLENERFWSRENIKTTY